MYIVKNFIENACNCETGYICLVPLGDMRQIGLFLFIISLLNVQRLSLLKVFLKQTSPNINETVSNE